MGADNANRPGGVAVVYALVAFQSRAPLRYDDAEFIELTGNPYRVAAGFDFLDKAVGRAANHYSDFTQGLCTYMATEITNNRFTKKNSSHNLSLCRYAIGQQVLRNVMVMECKRQDLQEESSAK